MTTFGVTDMKWFYPENENPILFRRMGFVFVTIGVIHLTIILVSYYGPNSLALIRESEIYLKEKNDSLNGLNLSFQTSSEPENLIHYRLNHKDGKLIAKWEEDKYVFTELNQ